MEEQKMLEMKRYNYLHKLDSYREQKIDENLVSYIHDNYDDMTDVEMCKIANKIIDINELKRVILSYELVNYNYTPLGDISLSEFKKRIDKFLLKYTHKAGGYLLEDNRWISNYNEEKQQLSYLNTVSKMDFNQDTISFIKLLTEKLNMMTSNYVVSFKKKYMDGDNIYVVKLQVDPRSVQEEDLNR